MLSLYLYLAAAPPTNPKEKIRPPVPLRHEAPVLGLSSNKNFITSNAVEVILAKPKKVPQEEFKWTSKPGYGQAPVYLRRNKARVAEEKERFETYLKLRQEPVSAAGDGHVQDAACKRGPSALAHIVHAHTHSHPVHTL